MGVTRHCFASNWLKRMGSSAVKRSELETGMGMVLVVKKRGW